MINFDDIIQRLTLILAEHSKKEKILDKEIAKSLHLSAQYYAVIKRRKKIPYETLAFFCKKYAVNLNWILLAQHPQYLIQNQNSIFKLHKFKNIWHSVKE